MRKKTTEEFIREAKIIFPNWDYSKTEYNTNRTKTTFICEKGHEMYKRPYSILQGNGCLICSNDKRSKHNDFFMDELASIRPKWNLSKVNYINNNTKIDLICEKGHTFSQLPRSSLSGFGCPKCSSSKGESLIREFLTENNIIFQEQKTFTGCKDQRLLKFDFFISSLNLIIEYDGRQHYIPTYFGKTKGKCPYWIQEQKYKNLKETQKRDNIKNEYCVDNAINLLRIK